MGWPELLQHARDRHGVLTVADAIEHGVSPRALRERALREGWTRLHLGVWLLSSARDTRAARHVAAAAAVPGWFSGESALWVAGARATAPHPPQLLLPHMRRWRTREGIDVRRTRHLPEEDRTTIRGFDATTIARGVADLAQRRSVGRIRTLVVDLERDGHLERDDLVACHERLPHSTPGRGRLGSVLRELGNLRSDSDTEHDVRRTLRDLGYPVHPEPFPFRCDDDVVVDLDIALPEYWVYVEVDGFGTHTQRSVFETDRVRWTQILRHWQAVWVTAERWRDARADILGDLDAALALADRTRPPARPARPTS